MRLPILLALSLAVASCAYASDYVVPNDGRARVVWQDGEPRAVVPEKSGPCELATREAAAAYNPPEAVSRCAETGSCGQVYVEPWIYIDGRPHPHLPLFGLHAHEAHAAAVSPTPGVPLHPGDPVPGPGGTHQATPAPPKGSSDGSGSSGGSSLGSLGDIKELAVVVAVIAILTMPAVAIALANTRPESESLAASAVDQVNAYNDLVRSPGSACSPYAMPAQPAPQVQDSPAAVVPDALPAPALPAPALPAPALPAGVPPPPPAPEGQR